MTMETVPPSEENEKTVEKVKKGKKNDRNKKKNVFKPRKSKHDLMNEEITSMNEQISLLENFDTNEIKSFAQLPLSSKTLKGLKENNFTVPTKVQRETLVHSLRGIDVVANAKTGSGKTLAFMIPLLEELYRNKWSRTDGLGALVITPTRELAYQIFELLKKIGLHHNFSSALVIGGKDWKYEKNSIGHCNILICTPGRLLHHINVATDFDGSNLQVLVLDEADRCLANDFDKDMGGIFDELPKTRKTFLFSATQTRQVKDLVKAGCNSPIFCSIDEDSKSCTPSTLKESYVVCEVEDKINFLFSFLKHHQKKKILVFMATCKQVRYMNSVFRQMRPGLSVLNIHGEMHQLRRMAVYDEFCRKKFAVMFATDVAARGLDIPSVDWVLQYDCPEDVTAYIHRAGRTARYSQPGEAILLLTPKEESSMIPKLKVKNIPIEKIAADPRKLTAIQRNLAGILVKYNHIFLEAQRAFKSYMKNIALMKDKKVFDPFAINIDSFAQSLGLEVTPRIRFLEKKLKKIQSASSNNNEASIANNESSDDEDDGDFLTSRKSKNLVKNVKPTIKINAREINKDYNNDEDNNKEKEEEDNIDDTINDPKILSSKKKKHITKAAAVKKLLKKNLTLNTKVVFDAEGDAVIDQYKQRAAPGTEDTTATSINIEDLKKTMKEVDRIDKKIFADKVKDRHKKEKAKLKEERKAKNRKEGESEEEEEEEDSYEEESDIDEDTRNIIDSLPDPDKMYNRKSGDEDSDEQSDDSDDQSDESDDQSDKSDEQSDKSDEQSENSDEEDDSDEDEPQPKLSKKRLYKEKTRDAKRAKLAQSNDLETLPISEQEQLALYLLQNR